MADRVDGLDDWHSVREDCVLDHPEYRLYLEELRNGDQQMVFIHLYVWKDWSRSLLKRFIHEWTVLRKHVTCPLYACADIDDDKWARFVSLFGFKPLSEALCTDGKRRRIYWHQGIGNGHFKTTNTIRLDERALGSSSSVSITGVQRRIGSVQHRAG